MREKIQIGLRRRNRGAVWLGRGFQNEEREWNRFKKRKKKQKKKEELCDCAVGFRMRGKKKERERGTDEDWGLGFKNSKKRKV